MIIRLSRMLMALLLMSLFAVASAQDEPTISTDNLHGLLHGFFLASNNQHAEAAKILAAVGQQQQNPDVMREATHSAVRSKNISLAIQYALLWNTYGGGTKSQQVVAELYIANNQLPEAEKILTALMTTKQQSPNDLYRQLASSKNQPLALAIGKRLFPKDAGGQFYLARLALQLRDIRSARSALATALQDDRPNPEWHFFDAYLSTEETNDPTAALVALEKYVAEDCYDGVKHCTLPAVLAGYANYVRRDEDWRQVLYDDPPDKEQWYMRSGALLERLNLPERAKAQYQQLPNNFSAQLGLARIAEKQQDIQGALDILKNLPVENKELFIIRETAIAQLLEKIDDVKAAIARLQESRTTAPEDFSLLYFLSLLLERDNQLPKALEVLTELTRLFPENPSGWNALGYVMADHNLDLKTAQAHIERALQADPNDPNFIDSLGWVHYRQGNLANARRHLEKAASLSDSPEISAHLGEVLWESGDIGKARLVWQAALARHPENKLLNAVLQRYHPF